MKKLISISFIAFTTFILMLISMVPHHHHEWTVCVVNEYCEQDNAINDEHTQHGDVPISNEQACVAQDYYFSPSSENDVCRTLEQSKKHNVNSYFLIFPIFFLASEYILNPECFSYNLDIGDFISILYNTSEANQYHGLRAPPSLI